MDYKDLADVLGITIDKNSTSFDCKMRYYMQACGYSFDKATQLTYKDLLQDEIQTRVEENTQKNSEARKRAIARIRYFENKREQVEEIIDSTLAENSLNITNHEQYIKYIDKDLTELQDMKDAEEIDDNLFNHLVEELVLLQDIITIIKGEE